MSETKADDLTVEFFGETFTINADVSEYALLEFAEAASDGVDGDTMEGLAATSRFVRECIVESQRKRFASVARRNRATVEQLTAVLTVVFGGQTERPTGRSSDSSDGPGSIEPKSVASSDDKASRLSGRPDLKLALARAS